MASSLKENMVRFSRLISAAEEDAKERCSVDLTTTQLNYLEIICELGNPTITELAVVMELTKPSVTVVVDRLVAKGLIHKIQSDTDKRSSFLHLTKLGEQVNKLHDYAHDYMVSLISRRLNTEEKKSFTLLLDKITNTKNTGKHGKNKG